MEATTYESWDANQLREKGIKQLIEIVDIAHQMAMNETLDERTRDRWAQRQTNAMLALNQVLKDRQYRDYEERLRKLEENWKIVKR
ncbi:MAG TPA: hypothetical protein VFE98_04105 [Candidatus Bathyarchaeia archaeon]|nr:hypothetical protein [Candidatus Bathyarchaeia archaeon]